MKYLFSIALLFTVCVPALAKDWNSFSWSQLKREEKLKAGFVLEPNMTTPFEQLQLNARPEPVILLTLEKSEITQALENPEIAKTAFGIGGRIKYQGLTQNGSLEAVAVFPNGKTYRVKASANGFTVNLRGSSDWTRFFIGLYMGPDNQIPSKIQVRINLPGQGTAFLSPMYFGQFNKRMPVQVTTTGLSNGFLIFLALVTALGLTFRWTLSKYNPGKWVLAFIIPMMIMGGLLFVFGIFALHVTGQFITFGPFLFLGAAELLLPWVLKSRAQNRFQ